MTKLRVAGGRREFRIRAEGGDVTERRGEGGQVHVFGQRILVVVKLAGRKMDQTPPLQYPRLSACIRGFMNHAVRNLLFVRWAVGIISARFGCRLLGG